MSTTEDYHAGCNQECGPEEWACPCRLLAMSDEEIIAEAVAQGRDVHAEAEMARAMFRALCERLGILP